MKLPKCWLAMILLCIIFLLCIIPIPRYYDISLDATDLQYGGKVSIHVIGWEYCYLLSENTIDFDVEICPTSDEVSVSWQTYPKAKTRTPPDETVTRYCELVRYDGEKNEVVNASFGFTRAMDYCIIEIDGHIRYVASTHADVTTDDILKNFPIMMR